MLHGLAAELNEVTRCFTLPLPDAWQGRTVVQVGAWLTGKAPRVGFGRGGAEHDPWRFDGARLVASGEADAVLWLASLPAPRPDWSRRVPSVALVSEAGPAEGNVVLTAAAPGEGASGTLFDPWRGSLVFRPAQATEERADAATLIGAVDAAVRRLRAASC
jgi:formylmethanofuran dehydrogenase subunit B